MLFSPPTSSSSTPTMKRAKSPTLSPRSMTRSMNIEDGFPSSPSRNRFKSSYIQNWAAHVKAAASLPPLAIRPSSQHPLFPKPEYGRNNNHFHTSLQMPSGISKDIRYYIATTINNASPWTTLNGLPHPHRAPLVSVA